jgi:hypothetical protein
MKKRRIRRSVDQTDRITPPDPVPEICATSERYVRWRNDTGAMIEPVMGGAKVRWWTPLLVKSAPESMSSDAESAGLTRLGYVE